MARELATLEELIDALDAGADEIRLAKRPATLVAAVMERGPDGAARELAKLFDRGQDALDRELHAQVGEVPQQAKDMMRAEAIAGLTQAFTHIARRIGDYQTKDGRTFVRK